MTVEYNKAIHLQRLFRVVTNETQHYLKPLHCFITLILGIIIIRDYVHSDIIKSTFYYSCIEQFEQYRNINKSLIPHWAKHVL